MFRYEPQCWMPCGVYRKYVGHCRICRLPTGSKLEFITFLVSLLLLFLFVGSPFRTMRDINIYYTSNCLYYNDLQDRVAAWACVNNITMPTRVTATFPTMLDISTTYLSDTNITACDSGLRRKWPSSYYVFNFDTKKKRQRKTTHRAIEK